MNNQVNLPQLTIYYDSYCPLCVKEMLQLSELDKQHALDFVDINAPDFSKQHPDIDKEKANAILHGKTQNGELLLGLDVTCAAWRAVDKHRWLSLLRWPIIKVIADMGYRFFARNRYWLSYVLTGQSRCEACRVAIRPEHKTSASQSEL
ncbi:DUF393 domain-containing protein [Aliikangiella marina]|uniref:DUF393 domain-containing protein n=1 Tax=Aliikangiella marina TaxID=1712262 RepID=A0A545T7M6_9GAMM|nr:DUF393 domain-containing protein [Aliikangiella marina]TQV73165.1 DUF393 domain-containing protein [Aliikangiella marina]